MLDLARSAVDAVVAELRERSEELVPDQVGRLEQLSDSLARSVREVAEASARQQVDQVRAGLDAVRQEVVAGLDRHDARLVEAVEARLAGFDPSGLATQLPQAVAARVLDGLDGSLPAIDKGIHELRELVGELVERGKQSDLSRQHSLDRLDEVLVDLRAGLTENVTRQHAVLFELLDQKLGELQLTEMAAELPRRIGGVISEAVQRSHDLQAESIQELSQGIARSLEAGLKRQRGAIAEMADTAGRMAESVTGFSEMAQEAVDLAFQKSQAAQAKRLSTMVDELRVAQQEAAAELVAAAEGALAGKLEASYDALGAQLRMAAVAAEKSQQAQGAAFADAVADLRRSLAEAVAELRSAQAEHAVTLSAELRRQLETDLGEVLTPLREAVTSASADTGEILSVVARRQQDQVEAVAGLREGQQRLVESLTSSLADSANNMDTLVGGLAELITGQGEGVTARVDALVEEVERSRLEALKVRTAHSAALDDLAESVLAKLDSTAEAVTEGLAETAEAMTAGLSETTESVSRGFSTAVSTLSSEVGELVDSVPERISADVRAVLDEARVRQERVEKLIAELAWVLGEQRAAAGGLQEDLSRALTELPEAISALNEAALRSEARITDLLARRIEDSDARRPQGRDPQGRS